MNQQTDTERALLGSIMITPPVLDEDCGAIRPEHFANTTNRRAFEALREIIEGGGIPDVLSLTTGMDERGVDRKEAAVFAAGLQRDIVTGTNAGKYARLLIEAHVRRETRQIATRLIQEIDEPGSDPFSVVSQAESEMLGLIDGTETARVRVIGDVISDVLTDVERIQKRRKENPKGVNGIPSGLFCLDDRFDGWKPGHLITLAARPSVGKTALGVQLAEYAARRGHPVLIQSLEMSDNQLGGRMLAGASGMSSKKLLRGDFKDTDLDFIQLSREKLKDVPVFIDDAPAVTIRQIWSRARVAVRKYGVEMVMIDYLQLVESESYMRDRHRAQQVDVIAKGLKKIARDLNITVLALAQLNREVEKRRQRRPQLSDLKESGGVEEASDAVLFLYRPHLYPDDPNRADEGGRLRPETYTEIVTGKNRHGATGIDEVRFLASTFEFKDPYYGRAAEANGVGHADDEEAF